MIGNLDASQDITYYGASGGGGGQGGYVNEYGGYGGAGGAGGGSVCILASEVHVNGKYMLQVALVVVALMSILIEVAVEVVEVVAAYL